MARISQRAGRRCSAPVMAGLMLLLGGAAADAKVAPSPPAPSGSSPQTAPIGQGPTQQVPTARENAGAVADYMKDANVSEAEAERRLALQRKVDDLNQKLIDRLGDGFSQVYFDNADGTHVVAISSRGTRERAEQAMAALGLPTRVEQRNLSHRQIRDNIDALTRKLLDRIRQGLVGIGLTAEGIEVSIAESASSDERAEVRATVRDTAPDATVVQTSRPSLKATPTLGCNGLNGSYCNELIGGIRYHTTGGNCTAAFYSGPIGVYDPKMMTAGHCITPGGVQWWSCKAGASPCPYAGWESGQRYGGQSGDSGVLSHTSAYWGDWDEVPGVIDWAYGVRRAMTHTSTPVLGNQVCHYGATTGQSCGIIDDEYYARVYGAIGPYPDTYIEGVFRVKDICVQPGDSGGPATNGDSWAMGIVSGVDSYPSPCYTGTLLVEPINRIQNTYGIYVYGG